MPLSRKKKAQHGTNHPQDWSPIWLHRFNLHFFAHNQNRHLSLALVPFLLIAWFIAAMLKARSIKIFSDISISSGPVMFGDCRRVVLLKMYNSSCRFEVMFSLRGANHCMKLADAWASGQPRLQFADYFHCFYPEINADTYGSGSDNDTEKQKHACVIHCVWDIMDCIGQLMASQKALVKSYAEWYIGQKRDDGYRAFVTTLACECVVQYGLSAIALDYPLHEFGSSDIE